MSEIFLDSTSSVEVTVRPSQALNAPTYLISVAGVILLAVMYLMLPTIWQASLMPFAACFGLSLLIVARAFWKFLELACLNYRIDGERIVWTTGVFSRDSGSLEMFRIQNVTMHQTLFERLCSVGSIELETQDSTNPHLILIGLHDPETVRAWLTSHVLVARQKRGFREFAVG